MRSFEIRIVQIYYRAERRTSFCFFLHFFSRIYVGILKSIVNMFAELERINLARQNATEKKKRKRFEAVHIKSKLSKLYLKNTLSLRFYTWYCW